MLQQKQTPRKVFLMSILSSLRPITILKTDSTFIFPVSVPKIFKIAERVPVAESSFSEVTEVNF